MSNHLPYCHTCGILPSKAMLTSRCPSLLGGGCTALYAHFCASVPRLASALLKNNTWENKSKSQWFCPVAMFECHWYDIVGRSGRLDGRWELNRDPLHIRKLEHQNQKQSTCVIFFCMGVFLAQTLHEHRGMVLDTFCDNVSLSKRWTMI